MTRTRNIGYILGLAGGGRLAPQSPRPLKGRATLEGVDYIDLWKAGQKTMAAQRCVHSMVNSMVRTGTETQVEMSYVLKGFLHLPEQHLPFLFHLFKTFYFLHSGMDMWRIK